MTWKGGPFDTQWARYRRWYAASWILLIGFPLLPMLVGALAPSVLEHPSARFVIAAWMLAWVLTTSIARLVRCPRCNSRFYGEAVRWPMILVPACGTCGLRKYASFSS
jgi:hypothetical protein